MGFGAAADARQRAARLLAPQSDLVVAIEEPEIYQHPTKQRLFGKLLRKLSDGFNKETGIRVQTIFVTHSPLLISIAECEGIRMVRRRTFEGKKAVSVNEISLDQCSKRSAEVSGRKPEDAWSPAQYGAKLHTFDAEIAEGFFAKCVVLVEGVGDKAIVEAWYRLNGRDPHAEGIVIAEVSGKNNLSKPIIIFDELGIPCYWIFANDKSEEKKEKQQRIKTNHILQRPGRIAPEKCVEWPEGRYDRFASWDNKLEEYISSKVGKAYFENTSLEFAKRFDIDSDMCLKFPASASDMLQAFCNAGVKFAELDEIVAFVDELIAT